MSFSNPTRIVCYPHPQLGPFRNPLQRHQSTEVSGCRYSQFPFRGKRKWTIDLGKRKEALLFLQFYITALNSSSLTMVTAMIPCTRRPFVIIT